MAQSIKSNQGNSGSDHQLHLESRSCLRVTGVESVLRVDSDVVAMKTEGGILLVRGVGLSLVEMTPGGSQAAVRGRIDSLSYENAVVGGFFKRLFA